MILYKVRLFQHGMIEVFERLIFMQAVAKIIRDTMIENINMLYGSHYLVNFKDISFMVLEHTKRLMAPSVIVIDNKIKWKIIVFTKERKRSEDVRKNDYRIY